MEARERRLNTPPTWKSSFMRAALAAAVIFVFVVATTPRKGAVLTALVFAVIAMALYVPAGYYLELTLYRRRQRKKQEADG